MFGIRGRLVLLLFFLSGITGLVYEIVWIRMLTAVFGHTVYAVATVLTAFMAGLGLGSLYFGRRADRFGNPLRVYAWLEVGIAVSALLVPVLLGALGGIFAPIYRSLNTSFYVFSLIRFVFCFAILIVPTTLMGATLPVLSRSVARQFRALGIQVGALYAVNTLGAVLGCFLTGFVLLEALGISRTIFAAAAVNLVLALAAYLLSNRRVEAEPEGPAVAVPAGVTPLSAGAMNVLLGVFGISGFVALGLEVIWTRSLVFSFFQGSSTYAFTTMLTVFLLGLGLGSAIAAPLVDRIRRPMRAFGWIELGIGVSALASGPLLLRLGRAHVDDPAIFSWLTGLTSDFLRSGSVMIVPTLLMGATFPIVTRIYVTRLGTVAQGVGTLYFANTLGAILGSFLAGFVLIPFLGMSLGLFLLGSISLALGVVALWLEPQRAAAPRWIGAAVAVAALGVAWWLSPLSEPHQQLPEGDRLLYYAEGKNGTVAVVETADRARWVAIDNVYVAGNSVPMMTDQKSLAHIPALFHPDPDKVLTVGFGSGGASWSFTTHPQLEEIHCVEIAPEVVEAHTFFPDCNFSLFEDPRYEIIFDDAKSYLLLGDETYDVISTDCTDLRYKSNADLYTMDYFDTCKKRLGDDGWLVVWMPLTGLDDFHYKVVLRTFSEMFPEGTLWYLNNSPTNYILLIGSSRPIELDWQELERRLAVPSVREDLAMIDLADPYKLATSYLLDAEALREFVAGYPLNTDDRPLVEFGVPKSPASLDYMANLEATLRLRGPAAPPIVNIPEERRPEIEANLDRHVRAGWHTTQGHLHLLRGRRDAAKHEYRRALALLPNDEAIRRRLGISSEREAGLRARVGNDAEGLQARLDLTFLLMEAGRYEETLAQAEGLLDARPLDPMATLLAGDALERLGRLEEADARYRALLERGAAGRFEPVLRSALEANDLRREIAATGESAAVLRLVDLLVSRGDPFAAMRLLERESADRDAIELLDRLAFLYVAQQMWHDAQETADRMIALDPARPEGHYYLVQVHLAHDELEAAERAYERIADPSVSVANVWFLGAVVHQRLGREEDAVAALRRAVELGGEAVLNQADTHPALAGTRALDRVRSAR